MAKRGEKLSEETKRKISKAAKARFLQTQPSERDWTEEKLCTKCEKEKPLGEFYRCKKARKSGGFSVYPHPACKACKRQEAKQRHERMREEGIDMKAFFRQRYEKEDPDRRRERQREYAAIQRRKAGQKVIGPRKKQKPNQGELVAIEPIARFLEQEIKELEKNDQSARSVISERTGVHLRRIYGILGREEDRVSLRVVDKLLTGLGCPHELHLLYPLD